MKWLLAVALTVFVSAAQAELRVQHLEHAFYMTVVGGGKFAGVVCVVSEAKRDDALPEDWTIVKCTSLEGEPQWITCYMNATKKSFLCGAFKTALLDTRSSA